MKKRKSMNNKKIEDGVKVGNNDELINLLVSKVLDKHGIKRENTTHLTKQEKENVKNIVLDIKQQVEKFLQNSTVTKTEQNSNVISEDLEQVDLPKTDNITPQLPKRNNRLHETPNDVKTAKTFGGFRSKRQ